MFFDNLHTLLTHTAMFEAVGASFLFRVRRSLHISHRVSALLKKEKKKIRNNFILDTIAGKF